MSRLPFELILVILSWLPVKTLLRCRCVCKSWCTQISSQNFIYAHLNRSSQNNNVSILFRCGQEYFDLHSPINFNSPDPPMRFHFDYTTDIVGSCNGLICLSNYANGTIFLLNLSTRAYSRLPNFPNQYPVYGLPPRASMPTLGFGYNSFTHEYKVVRIVYSKPIQAAIDLYSSDVMVYTLGTSSWRRVANFPGNIRDKSSSGIFVNDSLHWIGTQGSQHRSIGDSFSASVVILSFNVANEEFHSLPMPEFEYDDGSCSFTFLGVLRGCLCIFRDYYKEVVEVWVMNVYGVGESWNQIFTIRQPTIFGTLKYFRPFRFLHNGEILLRRSNGRLAIYDPRSESSRDLRVVCNQMEWFVAIDYVESLVSV